MNFIRELFKPVHLKTEQELSGIGIARWYEAKRARMIKERDEHEARIKQQQYTAGHYNVCPKSHT